MTAVVPLTFDLNRLNSSWWWWWWWWYRMSWEVREHLVWARQWWYSKIMSSYMKQFTRVISLPHVQANWMTEDAELQQLSIFAISNHPLGSFSSVKASGSFTNLQSNRVFFMCFCRFLLSFVTSTGRDSTQQELLLEIVDHVAILLTSTHIGIIVTLASPFKKNKTQSVWIEINNLKKKHFIIHTVYPFDIFGMWSSTFRITYTPVNIVKERKPIWRSISYQTKRNLPLPLPSTSLKWCLQIESNWMD